MRIENKPVNYVVGALVALAVILLGYFLYTTFARPLSTFANAEYGISFKYPSNYQLDEHHFTDRHSIVLIDKAAAENATENAEGPTAITFDIFKNPQGLTPSAWVKSNTASNFQLSNGALASTTQEGIEAVAYVWDGLYRGESYVFENRDSIVMASVSMLEPTDQIHDDFERVIRSLELH